MMEDILDIDYFIRNALRPSTSAFAETISLFQLEYPHPIFNENPKYLCWQYSSPALEHVCIIKAVRIVSAFNAMSHLLRGGFIQEIGVLIRTVLEFQHDITFLLEDYGKREPSKYQQMLLDQCLTEHFEDRDKPLAGMKPRPMVSRQKVEAGVARHFGPAWNPTDANKASNAETDIFSGFVHGTCQCVMEMINFPYDKPIFRMDGMLNTNRIPVWIFQIAVYLQRSFSTFSQMCYITGKPHCNKPMDSIRPAAQTIFDQLNLKEPTAEEKDKMLRKVQTPGR